MDYVNDTFTTFLGLDSCNYVAVYEGIRKLLDFILFWRWRKVLQIWKNEGV